MLKRIVISTLILTIFVACNKKSSTQPEQTNALIGTWNLTTMKVDRIIVNLDDYNDVPVEIKFNSDGTGTVWMEGYGYLEGSGPFIWSTNGNQITIQLEGEDAASATYSVNDNTLTLTFSDGWQFIFTKQT